MIIIWALCYSRIAYDSHSKSAMIYSFFSWFNRLLSSNQSVNRKHTHKPALICVWNVKSNETSNPCKVYAHLFILSLSLFLSVWLSIGRQSQNITVIIRCWVKMIWTYVCTQNTCVWISIRHFVCLYIWLLLKWKCFIVSFFSFGWVELMVFLCLKTQKLVKRKKHFVEIQIIILSKRQSDYHQETRRNSREEKNGETK